MRYAEAKKLIGQTIDGNEILDMERSLIPGNVQFKVRTKSGAIGIFGSEAIQRWESDKQEQAEIERYRENNIPAA